MKKRILIKYFFLSFLLLFVKILNAKKLLKTQLPTKIMIDPIFYKHHISPGHPETPERIKYIAKEIKKNNLTNYIEKIDFRRNVLQWIKKIHTQEHINAIKKYQSVAHEVAQAAVKVCLTSADNVMNKKLRNVFCAVRPPGHHALNTGKEEGFCYYNNIAITTKYLQQKT